MLPLHTATFPSSAADLARLLNESLQRVFTVGSDAVTIHAASYPHLDALQILLDGAKLSAQIFVAALSSLTKNPLAAYLRSSEAAEKACAP